MSLTKFQSYFSENQEKTNSWLRIYTVVTSAALRLSPSPNPSPLLNSKAIN